MKDDFHSLAKLCEFTPAGFVELQTFVKEYEIADNSLQKIFALIFGQRISKNQRLTNWEAAELTPGQQSYAAIDAWACVEIYNHLLAGKFHPEECPYKIDDDTAKMLQSSVGIHLPLKNADGDTSGSPSMAIAESTAINGTPVKRRRRSPSKAAKPANPKAKSGKSAAKTGSDAASAAKRRRSKAAAATKSVSASDTPEEKKTKEAKQVVKTKSTPHKAPKAEKTTKTAKIAKDKASTAKRTVSRAKTASKTAPKTASKVASPAKRKKTASKTTAKPVDK